MVSNPSVASFLSLAQEAAKNNSAKPDDTLLASSSKSYFWQQPDISVAKWSQLYPYKLIVAKINDSGDSLSYDEEDLNWSFTLPITPETYTLSTSFAIELTPTQGGINAEHNGVVFKDISIHGSTGILPLKGTTARTDFDQMSFVRGGTINAALQVVNSAQTFASGGIGPNKAQLVPASSFQDSTNEFARCSGYYQFHVLEYFLENYATLMTTKAGRDYRLVFAVYKDSHAYLVEPESFVLSKTANSAYEYPYTLNLKAYARIPPVGSVKPVDTYRPAVLNPNIVGVMLSTIQSARNLLADSINLLKTVGQDIDQAIMEPIRQSNVFMKELIGAPLTVYDLPKTLIKSATSTVLSFKGLKGYATTSKKNYGDDERDDVFKEMTELQDALKWPQKPHEKFNRNMAGRKYFTPENMTDAANRVFNDPHAHRTTLDEIQLGDLDLSPGLKQSINADREYVRNLKREDFEKMRDNVEKFAYQFEAAIGGHSTTVINTYGLKVEPNSNVTPTDEQMEVVYALNKVAEQMSRLAATRWTNINKVSPLEYVAGLANRSGIAFKVPVSKFAVPFPYGSKLEDLSRTYLGTPDRWMEIAQLNGLRSPYVDEEGFGVNLLQDGYGNDITVPHNTNLVVGQSVWVISNSLRSKRNIVGYRQIGDQAVVTLSGDSDMESYKVGDSAYVHAFLPDTVNSQMKVYIPSDEPVEFDYQTKGIPGIEEFVSEIETGGVSLLVDQDNDLIVTPDGGSKLSIGLNNIIQQVRIMLSVPRGTLNLHPEFGIPLSIGAMTSDTSAQQIAESIRDMFLRTPWRAKNIQVEVNPPAGSVKFDLEVPGLSDSVPVYFELPVA